MSDNVLSFKEFVQGVEAIPDRLRDRATDDAENHHKILLGIKDYLLKQYEGVESVRSFRDSSGQIIDCITFESQPSMRGAKDTRIPAAPDLPTTGDCEQPPQIRQKSSYKVPSGTIGMRRITVEDLVSAGGMDEYFSPSRAARVGFDGLDHYYAIGRSTIDNIGCHGKFSVYKNEIDLKKSQAFSLVQSWTIFRDVNSVQTIELILESNRASYKTSDPILTVATTNNNYKAGSFIKNLDAPAFVQTSHKWLLGVAVLPISVKGGDQYYLQMSTKLSDGKWWIYIGGETSENAVGYYPITWFSQKYENGLAKKATQIDFGAEVSAGVTTPQSLPTMGSGALGAASWKNSAYVRDCRYYAASGTTANLTLTTTADTEKNYNAVRSRYAAPWNETLWYGGPGVP